MLVYVSRGRITSVIHDARTLRPLLAKGYAVATWRRDDVPGLVAAPAYR